MNVGPELPVAGLATAKVSALAYQSTLHEIVRSWAQSGRCCDTSHTHREVEVSRGCRRKYNVGVIDAQFSGWRSLCEGAQNQATRTTSRAGLHD